MLEARDAKLTQLHNPQSIGKVIKLTKCLDTGGFVGGTGVEVRCCPKAGLCAWMDKLWN